MAEKTEIMGVRWERGRSEVVDKSGLRRAAKESKQGKGRNKRGGWAAVYQELDWDCGMLTNASDVQGPLGEKREEDIKLAIGGNQRTVISQV